MAAVEALASAMGDTSTGATAAKAMALGQKKLMEPISEGGALWDSEKKYWHAHSETTTQIFTDTLYVARQSVRALAFVPLLTGALIGIPIPE